MLGLGIAGPFEHRLAPILASSFARKRSGRPVHHADKERKWNVFPRMLKQDAEGSLPCAKRFPISCPASHFSRQTNKHQSMSIVAAPTPTVIVPVIISSITTPATVPATISAAAALVRLGGGSMPGSTRSSTVA